MCRYLWLILIISWFGYLGGRDWDNDIWKKYCIDAQPKNTPCVTQCAVGKNCGEIIEGEELTLHEKQFVLDLHNQLREEIARGDYEDWNFPPASNMNALNYDDECEYMTACWIRQCNFWHDVHFKPDNTKFGQNLHKRYTTATFTGIDDTWLEHGLRAWFDEYKLLKDYPTIFESFQPVTKTGHFTALIWAHVKLVGCAKLHFKFEGKEYFFLYCNYYPASNWVDSPIYSQMPHDCTRNEKYPHLCGKVKDIEHHCPHGSLNHHPQGSHGSHSKVVALEVSYLQPLCVLILLFGGPY